jgi:hypothetical protein
MSSTLLDLSGKVDAGIVEIFKAVAQVVEYLETPFFVVGATARDIVLALGYGIKPSRATHDLDLGAKQRNNASPLSRTFCHSWASLSPPLSIGCFRR